MTPLTPDSLEAIRRHLVLAEAAQRAGRYEDAAGLLRVAVTNLEDLLTEAIRPGSVSRACLIAGVLPPARN